MELFDNVSMNPSDPLLLFLTNINKILFPRNTVPYRLSPVRQDHSSSESKSATSDDQCTSEIIKSGIHC